MKIFGINLKIILLLLGLISIEQKAFTQDKNDVKSGAVCKIIPFEETEYGKFSILNAPYELVVTQEKIAVTLNLIDATTSDIQNLQADLKVYHVGFNLDLVPEEDEWYEFEFAYKEKAVGNLFKDASLMKMEVVRNAEKGKNNLQIRIFPIPQQLLKEGQRGVMMRVPDMPKQK